VVEAEAWAMWMSEETMGGPHDGAEFYVWDVSYLFTRDLRGERRHPWVDESQEKELRVWAVGLAGGDEPERRAMGKAKKPCRDRTRRCL
jgi:hypothetical protein